MLMLLYRVKTKKNTESLLQASREDGQKQMQRKLSMVTSHYENTGQIHNLLIANKSFENMVKFKYMGSRVSNQNCIHTHTHTQKRAD